MVVVIVELLVGFVLLVAGGEALVRGSVSAARRMGVSPLLIGLTLVGFGTSTPELVASLQAAMAGSPGIAIGNIVGSNIANILLILGISAAMLPFAVGPAAFRRDGSVLVLVSLLMVAVVLVGELNRLAGVLFLVGIVAYTAFSYLAERRSGPDAPHASMAEEVAEKPMSLPLALVVALGGIVGVVIGADLLVSGAIAVARLAGISETVIGLTLVAVGTSLPELVTAIMAALRKHADVAFGNVIGSNIFNILFIAGATAVTVPIPVPPEIILFDVWAMLGSTLLMVAFAITGWRIGRKEGFIFLGCYAAYLGVQFHPPLRAALGLP